MTVPSFEALDAAGQLERAGDELLDQQPAAPRPRWRTLAEVLADPDAMKPPRVVVPRLAWSGRATLLAAREKRGKSTMLAAAAAAVTRGGVFLDEPAARGRVLWVRLEEHEGDTARNLVHFDADPELVHLSDLLPSPVEDICEAAHRLGPALLVLDTLPALGGLVGVREAGQAAEWLRILCPLVGVARETDAALVVLHHANKSSGEFRDSTAIGAAVDCIAEMHDDKSDRQRRRVCSRGRLPVEAEWWFAWDGEQTFSLAGKSLPLAARIVESVRRRPGCTKNDVFRDVGEGLGKQTVHSALHRLLEAGELLDKGGEGLSELFAPA